MYSSTFSGSRGPELRRRFRRPHCRDAAERSKRSPWARSPGCRKSISLAAHRYSLGGAEFLKRSSMRRRRTRPVRPRRRRLDPERSDQERGLLGRLRQRAGHRPADHAQRVDRPARAEGVGRHRGRHLRDVRRHPCDGRQSDRRDGRARLSWLELEVEGRPADRVRARLSDQPDNCRRRFSICCGRPPASAADSARRIVPADVALRRHGARRLRPRRLLRAGRLRKRIRLAEVYREARLLGPGRQVQRAQTRLDGRRRRLPERRRHLHRLHDAGLPRQVHAVYGRAAGREALLAASAALRRHDPHAARHHHADRSTRNPMAAQRHRSSPPATNRARANASLARTDGETKMASRICRARERHRATRLVEMSWDPITRIVGSLGIYTKIDFERRGRRVPQHLVDLPRLQHLHEGQGPARRPLHHQPHLRDLRRQPRHLLGLRAEHGLRRPAAAVGEWIINLGEAAEYMFDHNIFQENLVGVDFCEKMVKETNPRLGEGEEDARAARRRSTATRRSPTS